MIGLRLSFSGPRYGLLCWDCFSLYGVLRTPDFKQTPDQDNLIVQLGRRGYIVQCDMDAGHDSLHSLFRSSVCGKVHMQCTHMHTFLHVKCCASEVPFARSDEHYHSGQRSGGALYSPNQFIVRLRVWRELIRSWDRDPCRPFPGIDALVQHSAYLHRCNNESLDWA